VSQLLIEGTEENTENPQSKKQITSLNLEQGIS
jgi:hypothetical protein